MRRLLAPTLVALSLFGLLHETEAQAKNKRTNPVVLIGIDGGEWSVVEQMWARGQLPNLKRVAEAGVTEHLESHYGASPVIWTSIATGMTDKNHGITGFTIFTEQGDVPFSSTTREVPALWNMLSEVDRKVATLSWWATWPAEDVNGVIVSERAHGNGPDRVSPASWLPEFEQEMKAVDKNTTLFKRAGHFGPEDRLSLHYATEFAKSGDYDLIMTYFRGVDSVSHHYWKWWEPQAYPSVNPEMLKKNQDKIPNKYEETDAAIGQILEATGGKANVIIVSDHGFHAAPDEPVKISMDINEVLKQVGLISYTGGGTKVDFGSSKVYSWKSPVNAKKKKLRVSLSGREDGGGVAAADKAKVIAETKAVLSKVTYENGTPAFTFREPNKSKDEKGADFIVQIVASADDCSKLLKYQGRDIKGAVGRLTVVTGTHPESPPGLFLAWGPDIDKNASVKGIDIHDITPTVLYALGLPIAKDFDGRPWLNLFTPEFQASYPIQQIDTWGKMEGTKVSTGEDDAAHMEQLRALGYID